MESAVGKVCVGLQQLASSDTSAGSSGACSRRKQIGTKPRSTPGCLSARLRFLLAVLREAAELVPSGLCRQIFCPRLARRKLGALLRAAMRLISSVSAA